jgi:outer membrane protein
MNLKTNNIFTIVNSILFLILLIVFFLTLTKEKEQIVYVDNIRLFNGFNMTKDLNQINGQKINLQKKKLDSLYNVYEILRNNNQTDKLGGLEIQLKAEDEELKVMNKNFSYETGQAVWKRLNEYVKEYSVANKYRIVLGTQGSGNVMYAEDDMDITEHLINYSNKYYEGEQ